MVSCSFSGGTVRKSDIANSQVTTKAGLVLDARQANPIIEGSMANKFNKSIENIKKEAFSGDYNDLSNKPTNMDTVDNFHASQTAGAKNSCVVTDANGYINANYINSNTNANENPTIGSFIVTNNTNDGYYRKAALAHVKEALGIKNVNLGNVTFYRFGGNSSEGPYEVIRIDDPLGELEGFGIRRFEKYVRIDATIEEITLKGIRAWASAPFRVKQLLVESTYSNTAEFYTSINGDNNRSFVIACYPDSTYIYTKTDNIGYLGSSDKRWKQIYAVNSAISTSDRREKYDISYIGQRRNYDTYMSDEQLIKFITGLLPAIFKRMNGESGRPHHGIIAQDFEELLKKIGLNDHAAFIKSPKTKDIEIEREVEKEDGTVEKVKEIQQEEIPDEYIYGIRYEELISDVIRFCQILYNKNQELEKIINYQTERIERIEKQLNL